VIPAGVVTRVDQDARKVYVNMTKDQIKAAPDWTETESVDDRSWTSYSDYYDPYGWR
jgi:hypothetical protein